jgi:hypothetical protein
MGEKILRDGKKRRKRNNKLQIRDAEGKIHIIPQLEEVQCRVIDFNPEIVEPPHRWGSIQLEMTWKAHTLIFYISKYSPNKLELVKQASARFASEIYKQHLVESRIAIRERSMSRAVRTIWIKSDAWDYLLIEIQQLKIVDDVMSS